MSEPSETKKRPASQYYWGDWHKDLALQSCPLPARGLWHEMNCLMHQGDPYGHLTINGRAMTPAQLANLAKITDKECRKLLQLLEDAGVFSRTEAGTIFSRRMVRDESARNARAEGGKLGAEHGQKGGAHGSKGGRPSGSDGGIKTPLDQNKEPPLYPPPSSSSSSSSSSSKALSSSQADQAEGASDGLGFAPSKAGEVGMALKRAGVSPDQINLSDPRLAALIAQGATPEEFEGIAREAIGNRISKPVPWVLVTLQNRREEAAAITLPPAQQATPSAPAKAVADTQQYLANLAEETSRARESYAAKKAQGAAT